MAVRFSYVLAVMLCVTGCATATAPEATAPPSPRTAPPASVTPSIDPALLAPLTALGPCRIDPTPVPHEPVPGLVLPEGTVVTLVEVAAPITDVRGYIPMTPVQLRVHYQWHPELRPLHVEDEVFEAEVLVTDGVHRLFVKAQAVCELGSAFVAIVAPEEAATAVPRPTGSPVR